jgi:hypothetical protein
MFLLTIHIILEIVKILNIYLITENSISWYILEALLPHYLNITTIL